MKRCPVCNSTKFKGNKYQKKCYSCGYTWKSPNYHTTMFSKNFRIGNENHQISTKNDEQFLKDYPQLLSVDLHDNVYKFLIKKDNHDVSIGVKNRMRNWDMETLERGDVSFRRTPNCLMLSIKKRFIEEIEKSVNDIDKKDFDIQKLFIDYAKQFQEEFNIILDLTPIPVAKEVKTVEAFQSPVQFYADKVKCVYPNGDIEMIGADAVESWKNFVNNLAVETRADGLAKSMDGGFNTISFLLTQQNEILQRVLNKQSFLEKIRRLIRCLYQKKSL